MQLHYCGEILKIIQFCLKSFVNFGTLSNTRLSLTSSWVLGNISGTSLLTAWKFMK